MSLTVELPCLPILIVVDGARYFKTSEFGLYCPGPGESLFSFYSGLPLNEILGPVFPKSSFLW